MSAPEGQVPEPVHIPGDLNKLKKSELVSLVVSLKRKLDAVIPNAQSKGEGPEGKKARTADTPTAGDVTLSEKDMAKLRTRIAAKCVKQIQKTGHTDKRKPYCEVSEGMTRSTALSFMAGVKGAKLVSDTKKMTKWGIYYESCTNDGEDGVCTNPFAEFLQLQKYHGVIPDCKFDGKIKVLVPRGWRGGFGIFKIMAQVEWLEARYIPVSGLLSIKIRTYSCSRPYHPT